MIRALDTTKSMVYCVRSNWSIRGWMWCRAGKSGRGRRWRGFSTARRKPIRSPWRVPSLRKALRAGACGYWRRRSSNSISSTAPATARLVGCSKYYCPAPPQKVLGYPPEANSAFVAAMEDVLAVYMLPHDPERPLVCLDETSKQLVAETRTPIPMKPGSPARHDYEYERHGVANLFMMFAPLEGWRYVKVTIATWRSTTRTSEGYFRHPLCRCQDHHFAPGQPEHPRQVFSLRSLPRGRGSPPRQPLRMGLHAQAWLLARSGRIELAVLTSQCLDRRIPDHKTLIREVGAWVKHRNLRHAKADWRFTTDDARIKLKHLYPAL